LPRLTRPTQTDGGQQISFPVQWMHKTEHRPDE
jgi:hypothetical protein